MFRAGACRHVCVCVSIGVCVGVGGRVKKKVESAVANMSVAGNCAPLARNFGFIAHTFFGKVGQNYKKIISGWPCILVILPKTPVYTLNIRMDFWPSLHHHLANCQLLCRAGAHAHVLHVDVFTTCFHTKQCRSC